MSKDLFGNEIKGQTPSRRQSGLAENTLPTFQHELEEKLFFALKKFEQLSKRTVIRPKEVIQQRIKENDLRMKECETRTQNCSSLGDELRECIEIAQKAFRENEKLKLELNIRNLLNEIGVTPRISDEEYAKRGIIIEGTLDTLINTTSKSSSSNSREKKSDINDPDEKQKEKKENRKGFEDRLGPVIDSLKEHFEISEKDLHVKRELLSTESRYEPYYLVSFKYKEKDIHVLVCNQYGNGIYVIYDKPFISGKTKEELREYGAKRIYLPESINKINTTPKKTTIRNIGNGLHATNSEEFKSFIEKVKHHIEKRLRMICPILNTDNDKS